MENIRMNYRYRDAHNYKEFGSVVFSNPSGVTVEEASALLLPKLISEKWFVKTQTTAGWHEFEEFELTDEEARDGREIGEFLAKAWEV